MPIIKSKQKTEKVQTRVSIENHIMEKIKQYCDWAKINKIDDFFQQSAEYVLAKDKDWLAHIDGAELSSNS